MKESFKNFLENRPKKCNHAEYEWCDNCILKPQRVSQILPDGTVTYGNYIHN